MVSIHNELACLLDLCYYINLFKKASIINAVEFTAQNGADEVCGGCVGRLRNSPYVLYTSILKYEPDVHSRTEKIVLTSCPFVQTHLYDFDKYTSSE